jgi:hypothetical protein
VPRGRVYSLRLSTWFHNAEEAPQHWDTEELLGIVIVANDVAAEDVMYRYRTTDCEASIGKGLN